MKALFCNTHEPRCGVRQYGDNLYWILEDSDRIEWGLHTSRDAPDAETLMEYDVIVYNWSPLIGGWMSAVPIRNIGKQVFCYHDGAIQEEGWDAILFSDPTMAPHGKWHPIGRPVPPYTPIVNPPRIRRPVVGVNGFIGAWADLVVNQVMKDFEEGTVRLQLPFSPFCDPNGDQARSMAEKCGKISAGSGVKLEVSHDFLYQRDLLDWLTQNDLNCYFRPANMFWTGVSSAPDLALAARKPLAVSRCNAFRHLHGARPSICVEDSSLLAILINGLDPLVPFYQAWSPENIRDQVESVLVKICERA